MKVIYILSFIILLFNSPVISQISTTTVHHYDINIKFNVNKEIIKIDLICEIQKRDNLPEIKFLLNDESKISSIKINKKNNWNDVQYKFNKDSLIINSGQDSQTGQILKLKFVYSFPAGKFNDTVFAIDRGERWYPLVMDQIASFKLTCEFIILDNAFM